MMHSSLPQTWIQNYKPVKQALVNGHRVVLGTLID